MPCLLPPPVLGNRGGGRRSSAAPILAARGSGVAPEWGRRERERPARSIPGRSSGGGGLGRPGRDGVRQRAAAGMGRRCRDCRLPGSEGKRRRGSWGSRCPPWFGLRRCGEGSSAVAGARGGGDGGWWCWEIGKAVVERRGGAGGSFIGALGRWSGAGWVVAGGAVGERCGAK